MQIKDSVKAGTLPTLTDKLKEAMSYERPAWIVGLALVRGMVDAGLTEEQAIDVVRSKIYRCELDGAFGDAIEDLAYKMGKQWVKRDVPDYRKECLRLRYDDPIWKTKGAA